MNIYIMYRNVSESNNVVSSTLASFKNTPIENLEIFSVNLDKINKKTKELMKLNIPDVIYFYEGDMATELVEDFNRSYPESKILFYSKDLVFKGTSTKYIRNRKYNIVKSDVYFLREKIELDYCANYEDIEVYQVNYNLCTIIPLKCSLFEFTNKHIRIISGYYDTFEYEVDAKESLLDYIKENKYKLEMEIHEKNLEMELLKSQLNNLDNKFNSVISNY